MDEERHETPKRRGFKRGAAKTNGEPQRLLTTRIAESVHRRLRLYCVEHDCQMQAFVEAAIDEKLAAQGKGA